MKPTLALLTLSLLITTGAVFAAEPPATKPAPMDHSKMDHSKAVDHQKMAAEEFAALDKNKDGKLNEAEVPSANPLILMYAMVDRWENVFNSINQAYMAGLMTAAMLVIELALTADILAWIRSDRRFAPGSPPSRTSARASSRRATAALRVVSG